MSKALFIKMVKTYLIYVFAFIGISTMIGIFLFNEEQTKAEVFEHIILGMLMAVAILIFEGNKQEEKLSRDRTESE